VRRKDKVTIEHKQETIRSLSNGTTFDDLDVSVREGCGLLYTNWWRKWQNADQSRDWNRPMACRTALHFVVWSSPPQRAMDQDVRLRI